MPIAITNPKALNQREYHKSSGNPKLASGIKKDNPKKLALPSTLFPGLELPHHRPTRSGVSDVKIVLPLAAESTIAEAVTEKLLWSLLK